MALLKHCPGQVQELTETAIIRFLQFLHLNCMYLSRSGLLAGF